MAVAAAVAAFAEAARAYLASVDGATPAAWLPFVGHAARHLARLYALGIDLPTSEPEGETYARPASPEDALRAVLVERDAYHGMFEPYEDVPAEARSLARDLATVYVDVGEGLAAFDAGDGGAAAWAWRMAFRGRAGEHATHAQRALHAILFDECSPAYADVEDPTGLSGV
jgi:hypothetical protein